MIINTDKNPILTLVTLSVLTVLLGVAGCGGSGTLQDPSTEASTDSSTDTSTDTSTTTTSTVEELIFVESSKASLRVQGVGGDTASTLTYNVQSGGQPLAGASVAFSLSSPTQALGVAISSGRETGTTDAEGNVTTEVVSGSLPGPVVVYMSLIGSSLPAAVSEDISVTGGPAIDGKFDIVTDKWNPPAWSVTGEPTTITASLTDQFGHAVPNGTVVSWTAETGQIDGSCLTDNGQCTVTWSSRTAGQDTDSRRTTILAYTQGVEAYVDTGSVRGSFDDTDTFTDLPDYYRDDAASTTTEANAYDATRASAAEFALQTNSGSSSAIDGTGDGFYNGPSCDSSATLCSSTSTIWLARAMVISLSDGTNAPTPLGAGAPTSITIADANTTVTFSVTFADASGDVSLPCGSSVAITSTVGTASVISAGNVNCLNIEPQTTIFQITPATAAATGNGSIDITLPGDVIWSFPFSITQN